MTKREKGAQWRLRRQPGRPCGRGSTQPPLPQKTKAGQEPWFTWRTTAPSSSGWCPPLPIPPLSDVPTVCDDLLASDDLGHYNFDDDQVDTTPLSPRKGARSGSWTHPAPHLALCPAVAQNPSPADADQLVLPNREECGCGQSIRAEISVLQFTKITDITTWTCECAPAPQQLLAAGLFPSAPLRPRFAVDMRVLEFAMKLFIRIAPNNTAWCATIESFLSGLGFSMVNEGSIRKLFGSTLEWYTHLRHQVDQHYDDILERIRRYHFLEAPTANDDSDRSVTPTGPQQEPGPTPTHLPPTENRGRRRELSSWSRHPSTSPTPGARQKRPRDTTPETAPNLFPEPPPRTWPSDYLRRRCSVCFGGLTHDPGVSVDALVCVDACFTQKRNTGTVDPPKTHPATHFVYEGLSAKMEDYVDGVRATKPVTKRARKAIVVEIEDKGDKYEHPDLRLPPSVLNGCESSFKAADERREKASTQFYNDTALMALLCRHDRVLWLHLPANITVGLLYDVACQLERSARKWGFLDPYIDWLAFAVAVFHAFGHEWACQVIYHPRKREGFGFTNGEGCKRFWHSISHLIAHLRISSYHHRLYTLDTQIQHADEANLFKLAEWLWRRTLHSATKCREAQDVWAKQMRAQTKPQARRSKTAGQKAVAAVLASRDAVAIRKTQVTECEAAVLDAIDDDSANDIVHCKVALETARTALKKAKEQLTRQELALGVGDRATLTKLGKSKYFELRMNAQALKTRLRDRLRARKFEHDRAERSSRHQQTSERKLLAHTDSAMKRREPQISRLKNDYNKLKALYALDVDDAIWQDVGLQDEEEQEVPLWLSSNTVQSGIRAMLELDRSKEEDCQLAKECESLRVWFAEEWTVVNEAMSCAADDGDRYQFFIRRERLLRLCGTWGQYMPVDAAGDTPWGPSNEELLASLLESRKARRGEDAYGAAEEEAEEEDFETLDAMDTAGAYQEVYESYGTDSDGDDDSE
ncbi:hypothetical protein B0H17DRAFT_1190375 [Mycena rosella]|uniref:CxC2-like cysteine cluster KDZ transposase-associated domain-containing protein n=1 Tax=Mycena rosella TaxID=1033263 RepID=A0AAD7MCP7_MYCRO|nr:hypothetical protein B0H17DRAFT_1190375 [Mycena rosella]